MSLIGYERVSTVDQNLDLQRDALTEAGCERIFTEKASGTTTSGRPQLQALLDYARAGDVIVVWRLDRLARSVADLVRLIADLDARGIELRSMRENIDTTTAGGKLIFHVFAAVAQFERDLVSERTKAGLAAAKARGRSGGRPTAMSPEKLAAAQALHASGELSLAQIAGQLGIGRSTLTKHLHLARQESANGSER